MDLQTNASKVVELDAKIKKLSEQFAALKVDLMQQMIADNVSEVVIKRKKVILCHRQNKDFGAEIAAAELQIKAEKKKLETLGSKCYTVLQCHPLTWLIRSPLTTLGRLIASPIRYTFPPHNHHDSVTRNSCRFRTLERTSRENDTLRVTLCCC
jgi:hypothetical protein